MLRFNLALHTSTLIILFLFAPKAHCLSWARAWHSYIIALFKPLFIHRLVNI